MRRDQSGHDVVSSHMGIPPQMLLNVKQAAHLNVKWVTPCLLVCERRAPFTALAFATAARQLLSDVFG